MENLTLQNNGIELGTVGKMGADIVSVDVRPHFAGGKQLLVKLSNGFGLSILAGGVGMYTRGGTYEVAVLDAAGNITYILSDDVFGYQSSAEVASIIRRVSNLQAGQKALGA